MRSKMNLNVRHKRCKIEVQKVFRYRFFFILCVLVNIHLITDLKQPSGNIHLMGEKRAVTVYITK